MTSKQKKRFRELAVKEALGKITKKQLTELEKLDRLRDKLTTGKVEWK